MRTNTYRLLKTLLLFFSTIISSYSQSAWTTKASLAGGTRFAAVGFSIGNKGYFATGNRSELEFFNDLWEYDVTTNVWTQKADVGSFGRYQAAAFALNGKGYVLTGDSQAEIPQNDMLEYDPIANTWTAKANYPAGGRDGVSCFVIGNKAYAGTGGDLFGNLSNSFYEYNPLTDTWTAKANFPTARFFAVGFSVGNIGYMGSGLSDLGTLSDFYAYNSTTDTWSQIASCDVDGARLGASAFTIGNKGYLTLGENYNALDAGHKDIWEYDPTNDSWTRKEDFPQTKRSQATSFSLNGKGYIGTGVDEFGKEEDFYEFNPLFCVDVPTVPIVTGSSSVCGANNQTYTAVSTGSSSYTWSVPSGLIITSGQGTGSIKVTATSSIVHGYITCNANNACGTSLVGTIYVLGCTGSACSAAPSKPSTIKGPSFVCGLLSATYSVNAIAGASYSWTLPTGMSTNGINVMSVFGNVVTTVSNSLSVTINAATFANNNLKVSATNPCGTGLAQQLWINLTPGTPGKLIGPQKVCNAGIVNYSCAAISTATDYNWSVPAGMSIIAGANSRIITVAVTPNYNVIGVVTMTTSNSCGNGVPKSLILNATPATLSAISGPTPVCSNTTNNYALSSLPESGTTYTWSTGHSTAAIASANGTTNIDVHFANNFITTSYIQVVANNGCAAATKKLNITRGACLSPIAGAMQDEATTAVSIYPNPSNGAFTLEIQDSELENQDYRLEVTNMLGEIVYKSAITNQQSLIDISNNKSGLYFVHILDATNTVLFANKVVKE